MKCQVEVARMNCLSLMLMMTFRFLLTWKLWFVVTMVLARELGAASGTTRGWAGEYLIESLLSTQASWHEHEDWSMMEDDLDEAIY